jgi:hypothetical protein
MITPPCGAERHQLIKWSTPRLLRYLKVRRKRAICYREAVLGWDARNITMGEFATTQQYQTFQAMDAEIEFIKEILKTREHVA